MRQNDITVERKCAVTGSMLRVGALLMGIATLCAPLGAVERRHGVLMGTVIDVRSGAKTVVVKTADGTEHALVFVGHTVVHGSKDVASVADDTFHGLQKGTKVVIHYTGEAGRETADEVDRIGVDGLKAAKVTVTHLDRGAKTLSVKTADGAKETLRLTGRAAEEVGKGTENTAKGTVYFTDEAGHKVAHFFERAI